jgi:hypothetical protein
MIIMEIKYPAERNLKMPKYKLNWKKVSTGTSTIFANSQNEAKDLAYKGLDDDFQTCEELCGQFEDWEIESITEIKEEETE